MSATTGPDAPGGRLPARRLIQWPMILWLTLVWAALWGSAAPLILVSGVLVGVVVSLVFPLPPLRAAPRIHPWPLLVLLGRFLVDLVVASAQVVWVTLRPGTPRSAVIEVDLLTESDLVMTFTGQLVSLIPGSVIVEARRSTHTLFLHVLDVTDDRGVDEARKSVLAQEQRVLRAFTSFGDGPGQPTGASTGERS
ncbi:Na+/H+ antiporter subunit E [Nocardioides sp. CFH 31398]|uniref:Na+/H+ antiporter subunit E n=1 Tax=Nocardioides sp. CFH 31398 TaxID=2919579 RepID=UPI001F056BA8|nr:Na+/H+ antiporter subunit E [Nocardioides sp. CFH 31398]MCH1864947.1 Na+/H+ antiporter subunit E [Nocardioides sp. CFH 31398]